jgi:hypothetical protein
MDIMVRVDGAMHLATIQKLSRYGARLIDLPELDQGSDVELAIPLPNARFLVTVARVVHVLDAETAARHGVRAGVVVRFREIMNAEDADFATAIEQWCEPIVEIHVGKPTIEIADRQLADLVAASRTLMFAGSLAELPFSTVLLMLEQARKSGQLVLARDGAIATIELVDGHIVDAHWSARASPARLVLMEVLDWSDGTFQLFAGTPRRETALAASVTELLLDRARLADESARTTRMPRI